MWIGLVNTIWISFEVKSINKKLFVCLHYYFSNIFFSGNPLKLDQSDFEKYNKLWQQNDLQTFIARSGYSYRVEIQWHQM